LIRCSFCDVQNFMVFKGLSRFVLPDNVPSSISLEEIFYFPYLRFKGQIFYCLSHQLGYKIIDTTYIGLNNYDLPPSLGLRPQAMKLLPVTYKIKGRFIKKNEKSKAIFQKAEKLSELGRETRKKPTFYRSFIGETVSIIYLPTYPNNGQLYDGVLNRPIGGTDGLNKLTETSMTYQDNWVADFITTICPGCGDILHGAHDSVILSCKNCHRSYQEKAGSFVKIDWQIVTSNSSRARYLPFWKLEVEAKGINFTCFGDLLRLTNQPVAIQDHQKEMRPVFIIPAFKIRPKTFLRIAAAITLSQSYIPKGGTTMTADMHPVTLSVLDAEGAIKAVFGAMTIYKEKLLPRFPKISFRVIKAQLVYLPFEDHGHDLIQEQTEVSIISNVLQFGRSL